MTFADNPKYKEVYKDESVTLYAPADPSSGYHTHRYIAAGQHEQYASMGGSKDVFEALFDAILDLANVDKPIKTVRSDIAVLCNNAKARMRYPVDEDAAIRMGAILTFMEGEDPDFVSDVFIQRKMELAKGKGVPNKPGYIPPNAALYTFFLSMGIAALPSYTAFLSNTNDTDYFNNRSKLLEGLTLPALQSVPING